VGAVGALLSLLQLGIGGTELALVLLRVRKERWGNSSFKAKTSSNLGRQLKLGLVFLDALKLALQLVHTLKKVSPLSLIVSGTSLRLSKSKNEKKKKKKKVGKSVNLGNAVHVLLDGGLGLFEVLLRLAHADLRSLELHLGCFSSSFKLHNLHFQLARHFRLLYSKERVSNDQGMRQTANWGKKNEEKKSWFDELAMSAPLDPPLSSAQRPVTRGYQQNQRQARGKKNSQKKKKKKKKINTAQSLRLHRETQYHWP